jgi:hypothetical protein
MGERQQVLENSAYILARLDVNAVQHPFQLERHGLGDEELCVPFVERV